MSTIHDNYGNAISANNPLPVDMGGNTAIVPIDVQSRLQTTIQTHNAVSVALSGSSYGDNLWHDSDGFNQLGLTLLNDASATCSLSVYWSNDGVNMHGCETAIASSAGQYKTALIDTKARYFKCQVINGDAALAHTMSAWAYLKA
jgi:hypothetical protein